MIVKRSTEQQSCAQTSKKVVIAHISIVRSHIPKSPEAKSGLIINHASMVQIKNVKKQKHDNGH